MLSIQDRIQNSAAFFFIAAVGVLSVVSVLGVWKFIANDSIAKSFETFMLMLVVSFVVVIAGNFVGRRRKDGSEVAAYVPNPLFHELRQTTLAGLIGLAALLAFLGVLSIWDVIQDTDALWKSLSSLAIFCFGAFVIVLVCLEREALPSANENGQRGPQDPGKMIGLTIGLFFLAMVLTSLLSW